VHESGNPAFLAITRLKTILRLELGLRAAAGMPLPLDDSNTAEHDALPGVHDVPPGREGIPLIWTLGPLGSRPYLAIGCAPGAQISSPGRHH
jgi:hypothetical protein